MSDGLVVVWGAGGGTGRAVVAQLLKEGRRVRAVVRNPATILDESDGPFKHENCQVVQGDVENEASCKDSIKARYGVCCHCIMFRIF